MDKGKGYERRWAKSVVALFIIYVLDEAESSQIASFRQLGVTAVGNRSMYGSKSRKAEISGYPAMLTMFRDT